MKCCYRLRFYHSNPLEFSIHFFQSKKETKEFSICTVKAQFDSFLPNKKASHNFLERTLFQKKWINRQRSTFYMNINAANESNSEKDVCSKLKRARNNHQSNFELDKIIKIDIRRCYL